MRRLAPLVAFLTLLPALSAGAAELEELLEQSKEAAYTAEQAISCSTPDGVRVAVVRISKSGGDIRVASTVGNDVEVSTGDGGWTLTRRGGVVTSASVQAEDRAVEPLYVVEDLGEVVVLGRAATAFRLVRDGVIRAELVFDDETGAMVATTTYTEEGTTYCHRRFISFDPTDPAFRSIETDPAGELEPSPRIDTGLPETVAGFQRLDLYEDGLGFRFAYYSDGFFSFAVFETPSTVRLEDAETVELADAKYLRTFTPGQATYAWDSRRGGMALVGDLPPDLHDDVLSSLPPPAGDNFLRRLWRSLFG